MRIKVLPLEPWMTTVEPGERGFRENTLDLYYTKCPLVFNRDGCYMTAEFCWIESGGRAYIYSREEFKYRLAILGASEYNERQIGALRNVIEQKVAVKKQKMLFYNHRDWKSIRDTGRSTMLYMIKSLRKRNITL